MGYAITWDELEKICQKLNMERQGKTSVGKGTGPDGKMRACIIHAKHKGNIGPVLLNKIRKTPRPFSR